MAWYKYYNLANRANTDEDISYFDRLITHPEYSGSKIVKEKFLNDIISNTIVKRASCRNSDYVDVRVPILSKSEIEDIKSKYGGFSSLGMYYTVRQNVPDRLKDFTPRSLNCDTFYTVYCRNILKEFNETRSAYRHEDFVRYRDECACFGDRSIRLGIPSGIPDKCVYSSCNGPLAYQTNQIKNSTCNFSVCNTIIDASDVTAGGVSINPSIIQACGSGLSKVERDKLKTRNDEIIAKKPKLEAVTNSDTLDSQSGSNAINLNNPIDSNSINENTIIDKLKTLTNTNKGALLSISIVISFFICCLLVVSIS